MRTSLAIAGADNVDRNGDFAAVATLLAAPTLPGTGEHLAFEATAAHAFLWLVSGAEGLARNRERNDARDRCSVVRP